MFKYSFMEVLPFIFKIWKHVALIIQIIKEEIING